MDKPRWAKQMTKANWLTLAGERIRDEAVALRCPVEDSGGARCTADAQPEHTHRYRIEDLP